MLISFIRTIILYTILIVVIRLMGKRQLGAFLIIQTAKSQSFSK